MRQATAVSSNLPHVKGLSTIGVNTGVEFLQKMGFKDVTGNEGLSLALGGFTNGASILQMAAGYAMIANDGVYIEPTFYTKVEDSDGNVYLEPKSVEERSVRMMSASNAYIMKNMLQSVLQSQYQGTATYATISGMDVAAKTGTTDENYDKWLCGFTPYYTAVTWFGFDQNESIYYYNQNPAGIIWANVMRRVHNGLQNMSFIKPGSIDAEIICAETGMLARTGCANTFEEYYLQGTAPELCTKHSGSRVNANSDAEETNQSTGVYKDDNEDLDEIVDEDELAEISKVEDIADEEENKEIEEQEKPSEEVIEAENKGRQYNGKYEIYQENNYYRYRLKASNGEILFVSEMYASRLTVLKSIDAIKRNITAGKTQIIVDKKKNYKFKLVAANHRVLAISANYPSEKGAQSALDSFKRFAITDDIVDIELPAEEVDSQLVEITKIKEEDKKGGKFVIRKDLNAEYSWELKANNGEILCQQAGYSSKNSVENAIAAFKENVNTGKFYLSKDKNNNYQFKLYSLSGRLASVGESYDSSNAVFSVVTSILNFTDLAIISDRTNSTPTKKTTKKTTKKA